MRLQDYYFEYFCTQIDVSHMNRSRRGWVSSGDRHKLLVNYDDDYDTLIAKCISTIDFAMPNPILIAGGSIIGKDAFCSVGHYMAVAHLKPGKLVFGIAAETSEVYLC